MFYFIYIHTYYLYNSYVLTGFNVSLWILFCRYCKAWRNDLWTQPSVVSNVILVSNRNNVIYLIFFLNKGSGNRAKSRSIFYFKKLICFFLFFVFYKFRGEYHSTPPIYGLYVQCCFNVSICGIVRKSEFDGQRNKWPK